MTIKEFFSGRGNLAIHCDTGEKAKKLLKAFDKAGYHWISRERYIAHTNWVYYKEETCYSDDGCYGSVEDLKRHGYTIIEFDEIEFEDSSAESTKIAKEYLKNNGAYKYCPWCGAKMDEGE